MKSNAITVSLAWWRKDYKKPVSHLKKKKARSYTEVTWNPITISLVCRRKDYKRQKSLACRRKYYKRQKEEKKRPLFETLHLDSKKKHSLTYSSIGVDNRLGVLTDLHFRFVFCFLLLCLFRLLHGLQFAAGCLGFFFIFFIFFFVEEEFALLLLIVAE